MLEVPLDSHVFHVDATLPKRFSKDETVSRYLSCDLDTILEFVRDSNPTSVKLSVQSKHSESDPYRISEIQSISKASDATGKSVFICECNDVEIVIGDAHTHATFTERKKIWPRMSAPPWRSAAI